MPQVDIDGLNSTLKADVIRGQAATSTKLGGDLDLDGNDITGTGDIPAANLTGTLPAIDGSSLTGISAQRNLIINGDFDIWQRGTSFAAAANGTRIADRWRYLKSGAMVHTISRDTDVPTVAESGHLSNYSLKVDCTTIDSSIASGDYSYIEQRVEGYNFKYLAQKAMKLSFWHKHTKTGTYCVGYLNSAGDRSYVTEYTQSVTDTWEKAEMDITASPSGGTWDYTNGIGLKVYFSIATGSSFHGTADTWESAEDYGSSSQVNACDNAANNFMLAQVQLEAGSVATDFEIRNHATELAMCQRYFERLNSADISDVNYGLLACAGTTQAFGAVFWQAEKRAAPTTTCSSGTDFRVTNSGGSPIETTSLTFAQANTQSVRAYAQVTSGLAAGDVTRLHDDGLGNSYIDVSAEL